MTSKPPPDPSRTPKSPRISEAEWEIMHLVWERGPLFAQEAVEALTPRRGWSPRTVKTLLGRLVKKGSLGFEVEGKRYRYHALVSREDSVRAASHTFLERVLGGSVSPLLSTFVREGKLSREELAELRALLEEEEKKKEESS